MKIKVIALALAILAFFLFVGSPFQQAANAVVGVDDALIAIIIAALSAMGITFVVTASYSSLNEYVGDLLNEYAASRNMQPQQLFVGVQTGSNKLGQILLNNRFVVMISAFAEWIIAKFSLSNNMTVNVQAGNDTWGGMTVYQMPISMVHVNENMEFEYSVYTFTGSTVYALFTGEDTSYAFIRFISKGEAQVQRKLYYASGQVQEDSPKSLTYYPAAECYHLLASIYFASEWPAIANVTRYSDDVVEGLLLGDIESGGARIDLTTGIINIPTDDSNFDDEGAILDVDAPWGAGYNDLTDVVIPGIFAEGEVPATRLELEEESVVQEQVEETPTSSVSQNASDYQIPGLSSVFPFCIPFDIYNFFDCLAADPVAPSFEWRFYVPDICDETIEIDLAQFNTVAQIVRTMELLAFIVGLAFVTRDKMIKG